MRFRFALLAVLMTLPAVTLRAQARDFSSSVTESAEIQQLRPEFKVPDDEALICCAVPAHPDSGGGERLLLDL